jgi:hypothetical protein
VIDWDAMVLRPQYAVLGVDAEVTPRGGTGTFAIRAIDHVAGIEVPGPQTVPVVKPAAAVMRADVEGLGLAMDDLRDGTLLLNTTLYTIKTVHPRPTPSGQASGEFVLTLALP